jgi:hypothetical protein
MRKEIQIRNFGDQHFHAVRDNHEVRESFKHSVKLEVDLVIGMVTTIRIFF